MGSDYEVVGIAFSDAFHGCIIGTESEPGSKPAGVILRTIDGGAHWTGARAQPVLANSIDFTDHFHGYVAAGSGTVVSTGTVLSTADGGATWRQCLITIGRQDATLNSISFPDPEHGWAAGDSGAIFVTAGAGAHWVVQSSGTDEDLSSVAFADRAHGWATGTEGLVIETSDGGAHWMPQHVVRRDVSPSSVSSPNNEHAWVVGTDGTILAFNGPPPARTTRIGLPIAWLVLATAVVLLIVAALAGHAYRKKRERRPRGTREPAP